MGRKKKQTLLFVHPSIFAPARLRPYLISPCHIAVYRLLYVLLSLSGNSFSHSLNTVAVILTLIAAAAGYDHWYFNEKYMTLENSGMYVKNNSLYSSNNLINRMKVQYTEDGKTEFVYAIDAPYAGTLELKGDDMLLQDFSKKTEEVSPEDDTKRRN